MFEEAGILAKHDFGDGRARYEETPDEHHDHLIDIQSGKVVEFHNDEIEELQRKIAEKAGYRLVGHRLELYGIPLDGKPDRQISGRASRHPDNGLMIGADPLRINHAHRPR